MKYILTLISVIIIAAVMLFNIVFLKNQLSDCRFEVNHLQAKLDRLQELNDYIPAMEQTLPPLVLAQLKVVALMIRHEKHKAYEGIEQPLIAEKEHKR